MRTNAADDEVIHAVVVDICTVYAPWDLTPSSLAVDALTVRPRIFAALLFVVLPLMLAGWGHRGGHRAGRLTNGDGQSPPTSTSTAAETLPASSGPTLTATATSNIYMKSIVSVPP